MPNPYKARRRRREEYPPEIQALDADPVIAEDEPLDEEYVPQGTVKEVMEWVGDDPERAQLALSVERAKGKGKRVSLESYLVGVLDRA